MAPPPADGPAALTGGRQPRERGFSLLEVLIALAIAGIALVMVFQAAPESLRATSAAARYQDAVSRARSHLEGSSANLEEGEREGDDGGGFRWRVQVRVVDTTGKQDLGGRPASTEALVITLYAVTVWINWREGANGRSVRLDSERLLTTAPS